MGDRSDVALIELETGAVMGEWKGRTDVQARELVQSLYRNYIQDFDTPQYHISVNSYAVAA